MSFIEGPLIEPGFAITLIWYGLYFGILTRDCAEVASDRIANRLGTARKMAVSVRDCALCGGELRDAHILGNNIVLGGGGISGGGSTAASGGSVLGDGFVITASSGNNGGNLQNEPSVQLSCKHIFHPECIRGWLIIGKKDSCPSCQEKVDLRALYAGKPWETRNISWIQMLDMVRYFIVWQPTILTMLHFVFHAFHMDEMPEHHVEGENVSLNTTTGLNA